MVTDAKIPGKSTPAPRTKPALDELPPADTKRWTPRRKAAVVEAVLSGMITIEEVCRRYELTVDEFLSWHHAMNAHGVPGLRTTRLQIYLGPAVALPTQVLSASVILR